MRLRRPSTFPVLAGTVLSAAALLMLIVRLPAALHSLNGAAKAAAGRNEDGGALAIADSVGLNDDFVRAAFQGIPPHARFAVVLPSDPAQAEQQSGVSAISFGAAPPFFEDVLMPRREVDRAERGDYIICYFCDSSAWTRRTHWRSSTYGGGRVGYVYR